MHLLYHENRLKTSVYRDLWAVQEALNRVFPSTKRCCACHNVKDMQLSDMLYIYETCGNIMDRDYNSAQNFLDEGLVNSPVPMEHREFKPAETMAST
ncbi:MAG: zinc ribbon domain-containing protein [Dethiobacteria bacterium]